MAYESYHSLTVLPENRHSEIMSALAEKVDYPVEIFKSEYLRWYTIEEDVKEVSKNFPNVFISLHVFGEEPDDEMIIQAFNGEYQCHHGEMIFPTLADCAIEAKAKYVNFTNTLILRKKIE